MSVAEAFNRWVRPSGARFAVPRPHKGAFKRIRCSHPPLLLADALNLSMRPLGPPAYADREARSAHP